MMFEYWQILITLLGLMFTAFTALSLKHFLFRRKYSQVWPSRKFRFFDLLGNLDDIPLTRQGRNGYSFNVFFGQMISGYSQIFPDDPFFCFWSSCVPYIVVKKVEAVETLISSTKNIGKGSSYKFLHDWLGTGLVTSTGSKWKSRRKLLTSSFHLDILKDFLPVFNEQSQILVKILRKETMKDYTDILMPITLCSLDIICETTLGVAIGAQQNCDSQYVKSIERTTNIVMERTFNCFYWIPFCFNFLPIGREFKNHVKILHSFTLSVIQENKKRLLSGDMDIGGTKKRKALVDLLMEHHIKTQDLTEEDIREELDTFAFAGHDTISIGMTWALYLIGLYKDVQEKIQEELYYIFGNDAQRFVTLDDLKDMKYLERVLKESLRLYPSVPFASRTLDENTSIGEHFIPKGTECTVNIYQIHRDETVFPNPEKFDPDRFLPENCVNRHPFAFIPFSAGPRNCMGQRFALMEEKTVVSAILRNYTLESLDQRDKIPPAPEIILRPSKPIRIRFRPREK